MAAAQPEDSHAFEQDLAPVSCGAAAAAPHDTGLMAQPTWTDTGVTDMAGSSDATQLAALARCYLQMEVFGVQARGTFEGKAHDLGVFVRWFEAANGLATAWTKQDTVDFLRELERRGRAAATINRTLATLKAFAGWLYAQPGSILQPYGLPTAGVSGLSIDPPTCRKLSDLDVHRLVRAALMLTRTRTHKNQRPWRDRAMLLVLLHTGLRVSELVGLTLSQYTGKAFLRVRRKGQGVTPMVHVSSDCRAAIDDYLSQERGKDAATPHASQPLFVATGPAAGQAIERRHIGRLLSIVVREVRKNHPDAPAHVHPHQLRHTFGAKHRELWGSDVETAAALGHTGIQHVARYTRKTDDERAAMVEGMF